MADTIIQYAKKRVRQYHKPGAAGFIAFCDECIRIPGGDTDTGMGSVAFRLWPKQRGAAAVLCDERLIMMLKARQVGMTYLVLAFFLFRALFWKEQEFLIVSLNEKEAKKSLERIKAMIAALPEWCSPELEVSNTTTIKIGETGSIIEVQASTENAGRGRTPTGMLLDEDAYQIYGEKIVTSALPGMEKRRGWMIRLSTGNGVGNAFEREWGRSSRGEGGFTPVFLAWDADPTRTQEWYDAELERRGREYMQQEFPRTAEEAFLASGRPFFEMEKVYAALSKVLPIPRYGYLDGREFVPQAGGLLRIWEAPAKGVRYVISADPTEGLEKGDDTAAYVVPVGAVPQREVAAVSGKLDPVELADMLITLGEYYSYVPVGPYAREEDAAPALIAVEANNMGIATNAELVRRGYRRIFYMRDLVTGGIQDRPGWLTTAPTRRMMLGAYQAGFRTGAVEVADRACLEEMSQFFHRGPNGKPQAGAGAKDDRVMARAIATFVSGLEALPAVATLEEVAPGEKMGDMRFWIAEAQTNALKRRPARNGGLIELGG